MDERFTACCGLCCADCIPSNSGLFDLVHTLKERLSGLQFDEYAKLKAEKNPAFTEYPTFSRVLEEIELLKCPGPCREGGGKPECEVKNCVQVRGYQGCWECEDRHICTELDFLRRVHPNLDCHLDLIEKYGSKNWFSKRGIHYRWQKRTVKVTL